MNVVSCLALINDYLSGLTGVCILNFTSGSKVTTQLINKNKVRQSRGTLGKYPGHYNDDYSKRKGGVSGPVAIARLLAMHTCNTAHLAYIKATLRCLASACCVTD